MSHRLQAEEMLFP